MKRVLAIALFSVIFLAGLAVLLYPTVSDYINARRHAQTIETYNTAVKKLNQRDYSKLLEAAHEYNERLLKKPNRFIMTAEEYAEYESLLDPTETGVMGTLEIDILDIRLPIYHGTTEGVLQIGLGHLEGSSLPVGGPNTHSVITGHRGLPSATLLRSLDRIIIGDTFRVNILRETMTYRVHNIIIVEPHQTESLAIVPGEDYCTLVTCTPYGINTHRLLVRGYRVDSRGEDIYIRPSRIPADARVLNSAIAALLLITPVFIAVLAVLFIRLRRVYGRGKKR